MGRPDGGSFERAKAPDEPDLWWRFTRALVGTWFVASFRLRYAGLENIPPSGGTVLTYNHVSVLDPIPVALAAYRRGRTSRFLGVSTAFEKPVMGWALRRLRQIPVYRGMGAGRGLAHAIAAAEGGALVGIAPEGTVGDGSALLRPRSGPARVALSTGVPILPVGVWGTQTRWPKSGLRWGRPLRPIVAVAFGPVFIVEGDPASKFDVDAAGERIMEAIGRQVVVARAMQGGAPGGDQEGGASMGR